jgi:hypothetical protein
MDDPKIERLNKEARRIELEANDLLNQVDKDNIEIYQSESIWSETSVRRYNAAHSIATKYANFVRDTRSNLIDTLDTEYLPKNITFGFDSNFNYGDYIKRTDVKNALQDLMDETSKFSKALMGSHVRPKTTKIATKGTARKAPPKYIRELVWKKYNSISLEGKCYSCGYPVTHSHFEVGHNKALASGGNDDIDNLRPICSDCNKAMGSSMTIEEFKSKHFKKSR